jgi:hypothetical protein
MILAVESGIHELGTGRQSVSQWVCTVQAGAVPVLEQQHSTVVMESWVRFASSRALVMVCYTALICRMCTTYVPVICWVLIGGKKVLLKKQNSEVRTSAVRVFEFLKNLRFLDNSSSRPAGSLTNSSSRTRVAGTRKSIEIVFCRFLASSDTLVVGHCPNKRPPEAEPRGHLFREGQIVKVEHIIHHV